MDGNTGTNLHDIVRRYEAGALSTTDVLAELDGHPRSPLSAGQRGLWALYKMDPETYSYNVPVCLACDHVDRDALEGALRDTVSRHRILSATVRDGDGGPFLVLGAADGSRVDHADISDISPDDVLDCLRKRACQPFDLEGGPLIRLSVLSRSGSETYVLLVVHHLVLDGPSLCLVLDTLLHAYRDRVGGAGPSTPDPGGAEFGQFVAWENAYLGDSHAERDRDYWKQELAGAIPLTGLPTEATLSPDAPHIGEVCTRRLSHEQADAVVSLAAANEIIPGAFLLAVLTTLLHRYTGQEDIVVGMPMSTRPSERFESTVGYFINMLPVRTRPAGTDEFSRYAGRVQEVVFEAIDHSSYPFPRIVRDFGRRDDLRSPVFQISYNYQNFSLTHHLKGLADELREILSFRVVDGLHQIGEFDLALDVVPGDGFELVWKYNPGAFSAATVARMADHFGTLIDDIAAAGDGTALGRLNLLDPAERRLVLEEWNRTDVDQPEDRTVWDLIAERAAADPDHPAVSCGEQTLTYRELAARSTALAAALRRRGVEAGSTVGVCFERSFDLLVGLLAVVRTGAAYVPLDPELPAERLSYMIRDSGAELVVCHEAVLDALRAVETHRATLYVADRTEDSTEDSTDDSTDLRTASAGSTAYIMYTSGSTGHPKGVVVPHRALTNFLLSMANSLGVTSGDRMTAVATYSFDVSALELYLPLIAGGQTRICDTATVRDATLLAADVDAWRPTLVQATPFTWAMLLRVGWRNSGGARLLSCGEALPENLKDQLLARGEVWNLYGPTETTVYSSIKRLTPDEPVSIGTPIANTQLYVLDADLQPVPVGMPGELCISGRGVATGYHGKPDLTAERFVENPFGRGGRMYRTGDLARRLPDGDIVVLGRMDNQVKLHGYRIELGEVEAALDGHPDVANCVVVVERGPRSERLTAYLVGNGDRQAAIDTTVLRAHLKRVLPAYMVPSSFVVLDSFPLSASGKVDRARLVDQALSVDQALPVRSDMPVPVVREPAPNTFRVERGVRKIFGDVLCRADVGRDEGFFEAGGDSFSAIEVVECINRTFGCRLRPVALFAHSSIAAMTRHLAGLLPANVAPPRPAVPRGHRLPGPAAEERPVEPGGYLDGSIAVVGMSCRFPGSADHWQFWRNLREGCSGSTVWSPDELRALGVPDDLVSRPGYVPLRSIVDGRADFDPAFFGISPRDAELMDPQGRLLLLHAWKAMEDAGYRPEDVRNTSVFTSTSNNFYQALLPSLMENVSNVRVLASTEAYTAWLLAQGGSVPTMISSKLGLSGPSMAVNTNCSSALSGVHLACQGLLSGEVDQALVGAASLFSTMDLGYVHEPGLNFSSDGRCRAFDDAADGMSGGEGVGVVLLKRAQDALAAGDHVYCLIRGVAVNNDGGDKAGFYAPSAQGQAEVIRTALDRSGVDPESIRYVEAHGTGTKLGDPIEVAALTEAYRRYTGRSGYCGIGSVKSNIGHLDAAAGIASLIKLALGLQHGEIPRTLHCDVPNREIDWENSPFFVADRNIRLERSVEPPRAGLSSFGVGGTNVHAVLEQAGPRAEPPGDKGPHLVVLSARDGDRLEARARDLLAFLPEYRAAGGDLASMAYTLQVGRRAMARRIAFLADDLDAVTAQLGAYVDGRLPDFAFEGTVRLQDDELVALFARTDQLKDLAAEWLERGEWEKIAALWVSGIDVDWCRGLSTTPPGRVSLPTYPFATTRFWPAAGAERDDPATRSAAAVPTSDDVLAGAEALLAVAAGADGVDQFLARRQQVIAEMDAILRGVLLAQLWSFGLFRAPGRCEQRAIAADQQEWLDHSVDVLVAGGELVKDGDLLRPRDGAPDVERVWRAWRDWRAAHANDPEWVAKAAVTELMVEAMPAVLAGESTATSVLFPDGSFELVEAVYRGNIASDYVNRALADSVRAEVDSRGPGVRILEVGAGTGSASRWVFDKLTGVEHAVAEYCYTDISTAFLVEAEKQFPGIPYLTYRIFNAERHPAEQGFAAGGYDIVVANNALHTTKDIVDTVEHTGALLRPGGLLLLNEVADNELWAHLAFGFLDGWLRHADGRRIPGGPALSLDSWRAVLRGNGFDTVAFPTERAASLGTRIVRARIGPPAPVPMDIEPEGSLDTYVDDALTQCLTDALRVRRDELEVDAPFADFGLDSLTGVNLVRMLNERLGTDLNAAVLFDYPSIRRLTRFVVAECRDRITEHRRGAAGKAAAPPADPPAPVRDEAPKSADAARETSSVPNRPRQREPLAIIGMSGRFPGARDVEEFWRQMLDGRDPVTPVSRWDLSDHPEWCQDGGFLEGIDEFDPLFFGISGSEASYMEPQQRLFLQEAWHALEDAGHAGESLDRERCGIFVGCADGDYFDLTTPSAYPAQAYWGNMNSMVPSRLAYYLDLHGPAMAVNTACSSSLTALYLACQGLWAGEVDLAMAGGVAIQCSPRAYVAGSRAGMLAPSGRSRSFDAAADGFVPAEGVGALVVRRLSDAEADGDHIHGVIRGIGLNQDGTSNGITAPNGNSQEKLLRQVYRDFEIDPETIGLVEAHGTGTKLGDPVEFNALNRAFRAFTSKEQFCALGSVKANIGHAGEAAGVAGVIKTLLAMRHGTIPGLLHYRSTNPAIALGHSPFFVDTQAREWTAPQSGGRRAAVTSLGASGTNVHAVIEEAPHRLRQSAPGGPRLIAVSARTPEALREQVRRLASHCRDHRDLDLGDMSYTLLLGRKHFRYRWAWVAGDVAEVECRLTTWLSDEGGSDLAPAGTSTRADAFAADYLDGRLPGFAELFNDGHHRRVPLPGYPFERVRYALPDDTLPDAAAARVDAVPVDAPAAVMLLPTWDPAPEAGTEVWPRSSASVGVIAATSGARNILAARYPTAHVLDVRPDSSPREVEAAVIATPVLDHLIWVAPEFTEAPSGDRIVGDQFAGTLQVFRTVQGLLAAGYGNRPLGWTLITNRAHAAYGSERIDPSHAGVAGLAGSAAKEYPNWAVRVVDVDAYDEPAFSAVLSLPADRDGTLRLRRNNTWFRHRLLPVRAGSPTSSRMREGGTYVIVGGSGGLGAALTQYLVRRYHAQVVWLGRSPRDARIDAAVAAAAGPDGPVPHYIRADATDTESLRRAREEIGRRFGPVHGLVHSGLVFMSASLDRMTETELQDVLRSKVEASVRLLDVFGDEPLDVVLFLSSINSYLTAIKQASYAAACTFVDSFAHAVAHRHNCTAKVINLGYCFNNAAAGNDRATLLGTPVPLIQADELMAAIERLCAGPMVQLTLMKLSTAASPRGITVGDGEVLLLPEEPMASAAALRPELGESGDAFDELEQLRERNRKMAALTI